MRVRAQVVLHAARGRSNARIARETGLHLDTVRTWRGRFAAQGLDGLADRERTGRHQARTDLGREFGATDVVSARGEEGIETVRELTGGHGTHVVLEAVGHITAYEQALGVVRPGGVPQYEEAPIGFGSLFRHNIRLAGGPVPVRAYIEELMPDILNGAIAPGKVFDSTTTLDGVPAGYQDMADRKSLKVLINP
ncbi:helix-turn-helix domain-containing protein [Streptomyces sp. NRRL S-1824]|uniref:helix-turn-helix domain-containing protein n=1 Tax=Streptomyces sp. NRRL S-1824 TaxID=1463889 RepID=UPI00099E10DC|nr:helix-turn-helix domain-containing protein [Streptomyces sp. NRRL S-1824]